VKRPDMLDRLKNSSTVAAYAIYLEEQLQQQDRLIRVCQEASLDDPKELARFILLGQNKS
jgi:hypothetical protein